MWLGKSIVADEHFVGTKEGVMAVRTVRRRATDEEKFDLTLLKEFRGTPSDLKGTKAPKEIDSQDEFAWTRTPDCMGCVDAHKHHHSKKCKERRAKWQLEQSERIIQLTGKRSKRLAASSSKEEIPEPQAQDRPKRKLRVVCEKCGAEYDKEENHELFCSGVQPDEPSQEPSPGHSPKYKRIKTKVDMIRAKFARKAVYEVVAENLRGINEEDNEGDYYFEGTNLPDEFPPELVVAARKKELESIQEFDVFEPVDRRTKPGKKVITTRWAPEKWKVKDVIVKSRFVVRGFDERLDEDANLFAATPVPTSVKAILALASKEGKCVGTADVSTAFLHAVPEDQDIWVEPPIEMGYDEHTVWRLKKSQYVLKSASRAWADHFSQIMDDMG